jgi:hydrogenase maturation factor
VSVEAHGCVTCGDAALEARVLDVRGDTALVQVGRDREVVGIELVVPVEVGDLVVCHAGIALAKIEAP